VYSFHYIIKLLNILIVIHLTLKVPVWRSSSTHRLWRHFRYHNSGPSSSCWCSWMLELAQWWVPPQAHKVRVKWHRNGVLNPDKYDCSLNPFQVLWYSQTMVQIG